MTEIDRQIDTPTVITEMADLLCKQKLVPFFGAGISRQHLGVAAAGLAHEMAQEIGCPPETWLADVADAYVDARGKAAFLDFLDRKLVVKVLDERKAPSHRLLVSLMQSVLYTTNQDNLFELVASKYGRKYRRIITVEDLSDWVPGEPLLIKFHGDMSERDSLVFGTKSYQQRIAAQDHPLDIRLRSDLLGKRLMFLGYSLSDENVAKLFASVKRAFNGRLPHSYLVAFDEDPELLKTALKYQVKVVLPARIFPEAKDSAEAFERFLHLLCDETRKRHAEQGISDLFSTGAVNPHIVTDFEVQAAVRSVRIESFDTAIKVWRMTFDAAQAPECLQQEITSLFVELVNRADPKNSEDMAALYGALFNFRLSPGSALVATAAFMAACNRRPAVQMFDNFIALECPALPDGTKPIAAATAVELLRSRGENITSNFRELATWWFRGYENVHEKFKDRVVEMIKVAWPGPLESESPLHRKLHSVGFEKSFHQIRQDILSKLPKRPSGPKE